MKTRITHHLMAAMLGVVFTTELVAQPTAFTYQGRLTEAGVPAEGTYDFRFDLIKIPVFGFPTSVGLITNTDVAVSGGLFQSRLDFGADVFDGSDLVLEIGVRTNGAAAFATLDRANFDYYLHVQLTDAPGLGQALFFYEVDIAYTTDTIE